MSNLNDQDKVKKEEKEKEGSIEDKLKRQTAADCSQSPRSQAPENGRQNGKGAIRLTVRVREPDAPSVAQMAPGLSAESAAADQHQEVPSSPRWPG